MNTPLTKFIAKQAQNGWIVSVNPTYNGNIGEEYVFASLAEMADWLRAQVDRDVAGKAA